MGRFVHRGFVHPGGVSPTKHLGHTPWGNYDHTVGDHVKEGVEKVKGGVEKGVKKVKKVTKKVVDNVKKDAKKAWDTAGTVYNVMKHTPQVKNAKQGISDVLAVASVPANIITEAVEGIGGKGDKEFNISDAMPDLSKDRGAFNFKNMHGKDTKTVSSVTNIKNPYLAFAVDLATDPSTYVGAGVIKNVAKKGIKTSTKALVKSSDNITNANKKQIVKAIDEGPTGPSPKGGVDGGSVTPEWSKGAGRLNNPGKEGITDQMRGMVNQGKELDKMSYNASEMLHNKNVVFHGDPTKSGRITVEVALPNGQTQMFYKSSGLAGKSGRGVGGTTEGMWQPFMGYSDEVPTGWVKNKAGDYVATGTTKAKNWHIKSPGYEDFYGSKSYRDIAGNLDRIAVEEGWDMAGQILKSAK